ncbi:MAG: sulfate transporter CysZ [Pseudomonadota bacterium]
MILGIAEGARFALAGFGWLRRPGLRRYVVLPLLVNIVIFGSTIFWVVSEFGNWLQAVLPESLGWLATVALPLVVVVLLIAVFFVFTLVANLLASPFNDRLAETVADRLQHPIAESARSGAWPAQILGAVLNELAKWLYFAVLAVAALLCWLFPPTTVLAPFLWLLVGVWIFAFEYLDYPLGNAGHGFFSKHGWIRRHRWEALGFGATLTGLTAIPVVNFFVMPAAVCGATALWVHCERHAPR